MAMPGSAGVGVNQKRIQFLAHAAGLIRVRLQPGSSTDLGDMLKLYPVSFGAEGSWKQTASFLGGVEDGQPSLAVLEYSLRRLSPGRDGRPAPVRLEARLAVFAMAGTPARPPQPPPSMAIPRDTARARYMLTDRLLSLRLIIAESWRQAEALRATLDLADKQRAPVRELLWPLTPLLSGIELTGVSCRPGSMLIEGIAGDHASVEALRTSLVKDHPLLGAVEQKSMSRRPIPGGWESIFVLDARVGEPGDIEGSATKEPESPELLQRAPPPGPVLRAPPPASLPVPPGPE